MIKYNSSLLDITGLTQLKQIKAGYKILAMEMIDHFSNDRNNHYITNFIEFIFTYAISN